MLRSKHIFRKLEERVLLIELDLLDSNNTHEQDQRNDDPNSSSFKYTLPDTETDQYAIKRDHYKPWQ